MSGPGPRPGARAVRTHTVGADDTASALGSGTVDVLGTPRLLGWVEAQTVAAVEGDLPTGSATVGTRVSLQHLAPSGVGAAVEVAAELVHVDGRLLRFEAVVTDAAPDGGGRQLAHAEVTRVVVDAARFLARA